MNKLIISLIFAFSMLVPMQEVNAYCFQFVPKNGQTVKDAPGKLRIFIFKNKKTFEDTAIGSQLIDSGVDIGAGAVSKAIPVVGGVVSKVVKMLSKPLNYLLLKPFSKAEHIIRYNKNYRDGDDTPDSFKEGACWGQDSIRDQDADDNGKMFYTVFTTEGQFIGSNTFNIGRWVTITIDKDGDYYLPGN